MSSAAEFLGRTPDGPRHSPELAGQVSPELLAALLPGVVHQLGNLMFTIQGNANLTTVSPETEAIQRAATRGAAIVSLLRGLVGDGASQAQPADELLLLVGDLLRVALRERGCQLTVQKGAKASALMVDVRKTTQTVLLCLHQILLHLPKGHMGTVSVARVSDASPTLRLRFGFEPAPGQLPFPVLSAELLHDVSETGRRVGIRLAQTLGVGAFEVELTPEP